MVLLAGAVSLQTLFFRLFVTHRHFLRTEPSRNFNSLSYVYPSSTPDDFVVFSGRSSQEIMQSVMNFAKGKRVGFLRSENIKDIFEHAKRGYKLTCNGMSELFIHALRRQGYKARKLFVVKSIGDQHATHTLVEVFENNKWVIYDPTFNVSFKKNGELLGAVEIANSLEDGSFKDIEPIFYGEVAYPARLEAYPIYWLAHFNNVLLFKYGIYSSSWWLQNTVCLPLRYWQGPVLYYYSSSGNANDYLSLINWFYFFFICLLPAFILLLVIILISLVAIQVFRSVRK